MSRRFLLAGISLLVMSCSPTISDEDMKCEEIGRVLTDREHIISALGWHFEADEVLRGEYPAGTEPGHYSQRNYGTTTPRNDEEQASNGKAVAKPPFVPAHFRAFKARAQRNNPAASKMEIITSYMAQYPKCCRALSPRWVRGPGWPGNLHYAPEGQSGAPGRWIKDVWVIDDDIRNVDQIWLDESNYSTSSLERNPKLKRFLFGEIFQKGDTASTQCGEAFYVEI